MSRLEHLGKFRERLIKKRDEVFETHRFSDEARLILSEHDIEPEETAQKGAIADVLAILDEKELERHPGHKQGACEDGTRGIRLL